MTIAASDDPTAPHDRLVRDNLDAWDRLYAQNPRWNRYPPEELAGFIARMFGGVSDRTGLRALDVGCGPGTNLWFLAREGFEIAGIDGAATAIDAAALRLAEEGISTPHDLRVGNFIALPWPDASFDVVVDIQAISHNTTPVIGCVIAEIHRVLKPGGWFFARMFDDRTTGLLSGELFDEKTTRAATSGPLAGCGIVHGFSADELRGLLSRFGSVRLDRVHRQVGPGFDIFEWIVAAQRSADELQPPEQGA